MAWTKKGVERSSKKPEQETFECPARYGMEITRSSDLSAAIVASAREEFSSSHSRRPRRSGIFPQRESSPSTPTRRYRSSIYSEHERSQDRISAIFLPTASSLYSRLTNDAEGPGCRLDKKEGLANSERAIKVAQEALFGKYDIRAATKKGGRRHMKPKTLGFFALLKDRIIFLGRKCLFLAERPQRVPLIEGRYAVRVVEDDVSPTDMTHQSASYEVFMRDDADASADDEDAPPYDGALRPYLSVFADVLENFPLSGPWGSYGV